MSTVVCIFLSTTTLHANAAGTPSASRLPMLRPASRPSTNISTMPASATAIAAQVRTGTRSPRNARPSTATKKGPVLISTKVLAAVLRVSERMKKKKVQASSAPDSTPAAPTAAIFDHTAPRCHQTSTAKRNAAMNTERQSTISQASAMATLRTKMPPVLQHRPAATMSSTPLRCAVAGRFRARPGYGGFNGGAALSGSGMPAVLRTIAIIE